MQTYDIIMLAILGISVFLGFWKGFAWQIATVAAFVVSYFVSAQFSVQIAQYLGINELIAMFGLFIGTSLLIWIGYGFVHKQIEKMHLKSFDRQIGALVGLGSGIVICLIVTFFAVKLLGDSMSQKIVQSNSGNYITKLIGKMDGVLPDQLQEKVQPYVNELDKKLENARNNPSPNGEDEKSLGDVVRESLTEDQKLFRDIEEILKQNNN
ncbi:CvpA family protein [Pirellulaceae bacterium]|jgi:membrane protein required for colicin V production|nr:CvpA family protein [Pirellulaceae bacterium]